jgi:hypothetical protein
MDSMIYEHEMEKTRARSTRTALLQAAATIYAAEIIKGNYTTEKRAADVAKALWAEVSK